VELNLAQQSQALILMGHLSFVISIISYFLLGHVLGLHTFYFGLRVTLKLITHSYLSFQFDFIQAHLKTLGNLGHLEAPWIATLLSHLTHATNEESMHDHVSLIHDSAPFGGSCENWHSLIDSSRSSF